MRYGTDRTGAAQEVGETPNIAACLQTIAEVNNRRHALGMLTKLDSSIQALSPQLLMPGHSFPLFADGQCRRKEWRRPWVGWSEDSLQYQRSTPVAASWTGFVSATVPLCNR
jgi:hypothetical protein